jgi:hypothetical protein
MSQDILSNQSVSDPLAENKPPNWSADSYADRLMEDLFSDLDRVLEGGSQSPKEPAAPAYVSLQPIVMPRIELPPVAPTAAPPAPATPVAKSTRKRKRGWLSFDKILLVAAGISVSATGMLWLASQQKIKLPKWHWQQLAATSTGTQNVQSSADAQFIDYMLRSLASIDRKVQASKQSGNASIPPNGQLPALSPGNLSQVPSRGVMERVYIPVYQAPPGLSALPALPNSTKPTLPPTAAAPATKVAPAAPVAAAVTPVRAEPKPPAAQVPKSTDVPIPSPSTAATIYGHTLVGVLELGDLSAALFEISGVTQKIALGQTIGSSGWTLVSITNQEAVVRRNGEVRSIYVGQKF